MDDWEIIYNGLLTVETVYVGIGTAMPYDTIDDIKNQQYPPFLSKFEGRKMIILIDPSLEDNLAIQKYFEKYNIIFEQQIISRNVRILRTDSICVFAIKDRFEYVNHFSNDDVSESAIRQRREKERDIFNLFELINQCINRDKKIHLILQDFSGRDTVKLYANMLSFFGDQKDILLKYILFDVTEHESGCIIEMNESMAQLNEFGHFYQPRYLKLEEIKKVEPTKFISLLNQRIEDLKYPLTWNFINFRQIDYIPIRNEKIIIMNSIYGEFDFNFESENQQYNIHRYETIIRNCISDIIKSTDNDLININLLMDLLTLTQRIEFRNAIDYFKVK